MLQWWSMRTQQFRSEASRLVGAGDGIRRAITGYLRRLLLTELFLANCCLNFAYSIARVEDSNHPKYGCLELRTVVGGMKLELEPRSFLPPPRAALTMLQLHSRHKASMHAPVEFENVGCRSCRACSRLSSSDYTRFVWSLNDRRAGSS